MEKGEIELLRLITKDSFERPGLGPVGVKPFSLALIAVASHTIAQNYAKTIMPSRRAQDSLLLS
jgi:hypothetical protein